MKNIVLTDAQVRDQATRHFFNRALRQVREDRVLTLWYVGQHGTHMMVPEPYLQKRCVQNRRCQFVKRNAGPAQFSTDLAVPGLALDASERFMVEVSPPLIFARWN